MSYKCFNNLDKAFPDGSTIDSDGYVWNAQMRRGKISRFNPKNGEIDMIVNVPDPSVTCVTFGGKNLDTMFITTLDMASLGAPPSDPNVTGFKPGAIYSVTIPGIKGVRESRFTGDLKQFFSE